MGFPPSLILCFVCAIKTYLNLQIGYIIRYYKQ